MWDNPMHIIEMANSSRQEHYCVPRNIFRICKACYEAAGQHFMPLLRHKVHLSAWERETQNSCLKQATYAANTSRMTAVVLRAKMIIMFCINVTNTWH